MSSSALPAGTVDAVVLDVLGDVARHVRARRLVAQELLDRVPDERAVLDEFAALVGMLAEHLAHPSEQAAGGVDTGAGDDDEEGQDLVLGQAAHRSPRRLRTRRAAAR